MADTYTATGPLTVGDGKGGVIEYGEGDVVEGAAAFDNLEGLVAAGRLQLKAGAPSSEAKPRAKRQTGKAKS